MCLKEIWEGVESGNHTEKVYLHNTSNLKITFGLNIKHESFKQCNPHKKQFLKFQNIYNDRFSIKTNEPIGIKY